MGSWDAPDDPAWDPMEQTGHTAVSVHRCAICGRWISIGRRYLRWCYGRVDGEVAVLRVHPDCLALLESAGHDERWDSATWADTLDQMSADQIRAAADGCDDPDCAAGLREVADDREEDDSTPRGPCVDDMPSVPRG